MVLHEYIDKLRYIIRFLCGFYSLGLKCPFKGFLMLSNHEFDACSRIDFAASSPIYSAASTPIAVHNLIDFAASSPIDRVASCPPQKQ